MMETLLVTGIHREELGFGDRVAALLAHSRIQVMRIPEGISHSRSGTDDLFYYKTRHREIYLQLRQQVKGQYRLLIDLHSGLNDSGRCADVYCRDEGILRCVADWSNRSGYGEQLRTVKILAETENNESVTASKNIGFGALTSIPKQIWNDHDPVYVGLEVYVKQDGVGTREDWRFACELIETIRFCVLREK